MTVNESCFNQYRFVALVERAPSFAIIEDRDIPTQADPLMGFEEMPIGTIVVSLEEDGSHRAFLKTAKDWGPGKKPWTEFVKWKADVFGLLAYPYLEIARDDDP